ncbi:hypothetical protein LINGRAHAP2_LOCUS3695 [Linum grandiflorum]
MDIEVPQSKQVSSPEEATREALIAISHLDDAAETLSYKDGGAVNNRGGKEKYMILENYMNADARCSREATREALIGISYSMPDNGGVETLSYKDVGGGGGGIDKYMNELISISDSQSPDSATYPVVVDSGNHKCY